MKVKITQCSNKAYWYADKIGEIFSVIKETETSYWPFVDMSIAKSDCIHVEDDIPETVMIEVTDMFHHCFRRKFKAVPSKDIYKCTEYNFVFRKDQCREVTNTQEHCKVVDKQRTPIGWRLNIDIPEWELTAGTESLIRGKDDIFTFYDKDDSATYLPISILPHIATPIYEPKPDENGWWKFEEKKPERDEFIWSDEWEKPFKYPDGRTFTKWQPCVKPKI